MLQSAAAGSELQLHVGPQAEGTSERLFGGQRLRPAAKDGPGRPSTHPHLASCARCRRWNGRTHSRQTAAGRRTQGRSSRLRPPGSGVHQTPLYLFRDWMMGANQTTVIIGGITTHFSCKFIYSAGFYFHKVSIMEASGRVGGRVETYRNEEEGWWAELGAMRIPGFHQ